MNNESQWGAYVARVSADARTNAEVAEKTGVSEATIGRWKAGKTGPNPREAVALARAYGEHPLGALVSAGFLTLEELDMVADGIQMPKKWTLEDFETEELAREVADRLAFEREHPGGLSN